jgi:hypothetical protein
VLKSIWLEGKRNWHVDHLIYTLVIEFLSDLEFCHKRQELGMDGPNLAEKHCQQILEHAPETPLNKIRKIEDLHFEVQSLNSNTSYHIHLDTLTCNCSDFPRIRLYKHIAAVVHFFEGANLGPWPTEDACASELVELGSLIQRDSSGSTDDGDIKSIVPAANEIISLTQELISKAPHDPEIAKSLKSI